MSLWIEAITQRRANGVFLASCRVGESGAIATGWLPYGLYVHGRFLLLGTSLLVLVFLVRGSAGIAEVMRPMLHWRVAPAWYLIAILWAAGNMVLFLLAKGVVTGNGLSEVRLDLSLIQRPDILRAIFIGSFIGEIVWVSYAVGRLKESFNLYTAALIVGVVWTIWWAPNVVLNVGIVACHRYHLCYDRTLFAQSERRGDPLLGGKW